jgi:hypothetical protein
VTGWLKDFSGSYVMPMFVVGGLMLLSGVLMVALSRREETSPGATTATSSAEDLGPVGALASEPVR